MCMQHFVQDETKQTKKKKNKHTRTDKNAYILHVYNSTYLMLNHVLDHTAGSSSSARLILQEYILSNTNKDTLTKILIADDK